MPVYDAAHVPDTVGRGTLDPELEAWLPSGPTLGADVPIAQGRRDHTQLGGAPWPSIGVGSDSANAESHAGQPPAILVTNGFDPLRDVGHA